MYDFSKRCPTLPFPSRILSIYLSITRSPNDNKNYRTLFALFVITTTSKALEYAKSLKKSRPRRRAKINLLRVAFPRISNARHSKLRSGLILDCGRLSSCILVRWINVKAKTRHSSHTPRKGSSLLGRTNPHYLQPIPRR